MISSGHPMYEEEEARTKWCPHVRTAWAMNPQNDDAPICTSNRGNTDDKCRCVASDCMMWRLQPLMADPAFAEAVKARAEKTGDKDPSRRDSAAYVLAHRSEYDLHDKPFMGYCGLAGGFLT